MCLLGICGWTLANTFKPTTLGFLDIQTGINQDSYYNNRNNNSTAPAAEEINKNGTILTLQSSSSSVILEETNEHNNNNNDSPNFIRIWETMSPKFKRIIQICTSAAIGIGIFQLLVSMTILCSTQKVRSSYKTGLKVFSKILSAFLRSQTLRISQSVSFKVTSIFFIFQGVN